MRILSTHGHETEERPDHYEHQDANTRGVWWFLFGLLSFLVISAFGMAGIYRFFGAQPGMAPDELTPLAPARQVPPTPRLQTRPQLDMEATRTYEHRVLATYGWVDQKAGTVRIPIERESCCSQPRRSPKAAPKRPN